MRSNLASKPAGALRFTVAAGRAVVLPPPRRVFSRRGGPGLHARLLLGISVIDSLATVALLIAGNPAAAAEAFTAATLLIVALLLLA